MRGKTSVIGATGSQVTSPVQTGGPSQTGGPAQAASRVGTNWARWLAAAAVLVPKGGADAGLGGAAPLPRGWMPLTAGAGAAVLLGAGLVLAWRRRRTAVTG
ncbi:MAG: hypothetical protein ACRDT8_10535 [Micromonosporaceae bacterium]